MYGSKKRRSEPARPRARWTILAAAIAVAVGLGMTAVAWAVHQPGVDVQVNNSAGDTPENTTQSETALAVFGNTICAGFNDSGGAGLSGFARSTNLGDTWTDQGSLGAGRNGDPVVAVHEATGDFYYANNATIGGNPAIGVQRSTDDCVTFGGQADASAASSVLQAAPNVTTLSDKPWIAVDNTGGANDGNIYVCWTRFIDTNNPSDGNADTSELRFSRSINNGATFVNEQVIQAQGPAPFGCSIKVGPTGQVYVTWADRFGGTLGDIRFRASTDGGLTFGANTQVSTGNRLPGTDNVVNCGPNNNRTALNGNIRMLHQSWLAVDTTGGPFDGNLYAVWASDPVSPMGTTDHSDVFFSRSTNGGANWSAPLQLGGGTVTDQFEPFVEVAGAGAVSVAWYDRRNDAANNFNIDVFKAFSTDGGATFGGIQRVTDQTFGVPPINPNFDPRIANCYMGEYIGVAGDDRNFYYLWGDNRNTLTTTNFPAGRADPDVFFESEVAPIVNTADLEITKSDNPDPVVAGGQLVYTITVENNGPDIALDVVVTDTLPSEVTYISDTGSCDTSALPVLTCDLGDMPSGSTSSFTITVTVSSSANGTITNTSSVTGIAVDPNPANNSDSEDTLVFAFAPGGGAFVVGDQSATGSVTFWGAQWWKKNSLSGGPAPASFKGFALNPTVPSCGTQWSTDPGNSAPPPPPPLPDFMGVIVTSSTSKSGNQISGNTVHMVVVQTDPGYNATPGKAGTGIVVAKIC